MKPTRPLQQCVALLRDGTRCGKYAKPGETLCAVHQPGYTPKGAAVPRPKPISYEDRLAQFAESKDPRVAIRAIDMLERRRRGDDDTRRDPWPAFVKALTGDERATLESLVAQFRSFKAGVWARRPDLRPEGICAPEQS